MTLLEYRELQVGDVLRQVKVSDDLNTAAGTLWKVMDTTTYNYRGFECSTNSGKRWAYNPLGVNECWWYNYRKLGVLCDVVKDEGKDEGKNMSKKTEHVHAELIKAWADGYEIERFDKYANDGFGEWVSSTNPHWKRAVKYRKKQKAKPEQVYKRFIYDYGYATPRLTEWYCAESKSVTDCENSLKYTLAATKTRSELIEYLKQSTN